MIFANEQANSKETLDARGSKSSTVFGTGHLLQPEPPGIIVIDEPELGLHPSAISVLGALVQTAAEQSQIVMTTQSPRLLDALESNDVIVTTHESISPGRFATKFKRLDAENLSSWLDDYCLNDLWEKNVLGGKPSR